MLPQTTWVVVIRSRRVRLAKSSMRRSISAPKSMRQRRIATPMSSNAEIRIGAAVGDDDVAAAALDERVEARVVEVAAVGQVAVRADLPGIATASRAGCRRATAARAARASDAPDGVGAQKPRRTLKSDRNNASAALGVFEPMFGLTAAPEIGGGRRQRQLAVHVLGRAAVARPRRAAVVPRHDEILSRPLRHGQVRSADQAQRRVDDVVRRAGVVIAEPRSARYRRHGAESVISSL